MADDSPEYEQFGVTEDDLLAELDPGHRRGKQTKGQATYGIWAEKEDDDDTGRPSFSGGSGRKSRGGKGGGDLTRPVAFVSGGVVKKAGAEATKEEEGEEQIDVDELLRQKFFNKASKETVQKKGGVVIRNKTSSYAGWERHTKGIGSKLMAQMGYVVGKGLGKDLQGRAAPVEAVLRKGKAALGYYGEERPRDEEEREREAMLVTGEETVEVTRQWKKSRGGGKTKYVYKTAAELLESGATSRSGGIVSEMNQHSTVKVVDMTKREARVYTGYQALQYRHEQPDEQTAPSRNKQVDRTFDVPELSHNLQVLLDLAESEIVDFARRARQEENRNVVAEQEAIRLDRVIAEQEEDITALEQVLELIRQLDRPDLSLETITPVLESIKCDFPSEYKLYGLERAALSSLGPLLMTTFAPPYSPLRDPHRGLTECLQLKRVLGEVQDRFVSDGEMDPYSRLLWEAWVPAVRRDITLWSPRQPVPLCQLLELWHDALPPWLENNLLESLILPKLAYAVEEWDPLRDVVPIHNWIHPWLPLLGERLDPLYPPIRHKIGHALKAGWHPSDKSAKSILQPWVGVFSEGAVKTFVAQYVLPKIIAVVDEWQVTPEHQDWSVWGWMMDWVNLAPVTHMSQILDRHFFPKWLQVLTYWLDGSPAGDEIAHWISEWESRFPPILMREPAVLEWFSRARALASGTKPVVRSQPLPEAARAPSTLSSEVTTFKDMLERRAAERGIEFLPVPHKSIEGKQVYKCGSVQCYVDNNVTFVREAGQWRPVGLDTLFSMAGS